MHLTYPNLELLEYKVRLNLKQQEVFQTRLDKLQQKNLHFSAEVFPQTWGNTATGFDEVDGQPTIAGQAFTEAYTTVFHEHNTDVYVVCFGNNPCYFVHNASKKFFEDLKDRRMVSLSNARKRY